jgi:hypothetical protein
MNLIQRWITASRANREKSVKKSIAQGIVHRSYEGNRAAEPLAAPAYENSFPSAFFGVTSPRSS